MIDYLGMFLFGFGMTAMLLLAGPLMDVFRKGGRAIYVSHLAALPHRRPGTLLVIDRRGQQTRMVREDKTEILIECTPQQHDALVAAVQGSRQPVPTGTGRGVVLP